MVPLLNEICSIVLQSFVNNLLWFTKLSTLFKSKCNVFHKISPLYFNVLRSVWDFNILISNFSPFLVFRMVVYILSSLCPFPLTILCISTAIFLLHMHSILFQLALWSTRISLTFSFAFLTVLLVYDKATFCDMISEYFARKTHFRAQKYSFRALNYCPVHTTQTNLGSPKVSLI